MTKIVCISDTHGVFPSIPDGDVLIHAWDWAGHSTFEETKEFLIWFNGLPHKHKIVIAGNHDRMTENNPIGFGKALSKYAPKCLYLQDSGVEIDGIKYWGSPVSPEFYNWAYPWLWRQAKEDDA